MKCSDCGAINYQVPYKPHVGDRVEIIEQGVSWGEGRIEAEHKIGGRTTGYRVHRDVGVVKVVSPEQVRKK